MSTAEVYEALIVELAPLGREELLRRLGELHPGFPLDFSESFLQTCETERLRHLVLAAAWQCRCKELRNTGSAAAMEEAGDEVGAGSGLAHAAQ
ncbi:MAG TPA: hypothetical protein VHQ47_15740 [Phycisphaerae bacterium]|nr:hypothetical protein [Phycisphaerae bacterium]